MAAFFLGTAMQIATNISDTCKAHDTIKYPSIERQVYDFFVPHFDSLEYEFDRDGMNLKLDGTECSVAVGKKGVTIALVPPYTHDGRIKFGEGKYPSVKLPFNTDVEKRVNKFVTAARKIKTLEERAKAIPVPSAKKIEDFLNAELGTEDVVARYWHDDLFGGLEIHFYLHPKGEAPAEGVMLCVEKDTGKLDTFWNGKTPRRSHGGTPNKFGEPLDWAVGRDRGGYHRTQETLDALKNRISKIEKVKARVDAFDPNKSKEFLKLIDLKRKADELLKEFKAL